MSGNPYAAIGERHALVTISDLPGHDRAPWAQLTGGAQTAPVTRNYNGGSKKANIIPGRVVIADIVVMRPFEPGRDAALIAALRTQVSKFVARSISKQYLDLDGVAVGKPEVFTGNLLTTITAPNYNEDSANGAMISLTFTPSDVI